MTELEAVIASCLVRTEIKLWRKRNVTLVIVSTSAARWLRAGGEGLTSGLTRAAHN